MSSKKEETLENSPLRQLQLVELDILKEVAKLCEENDLRYFLMGGTFLGAVRHKGFIPWDDDIDIGMPRPDYERFISIAQRNLPEYLQYKNFRIGNEQTIYFARVENSKIRIEDTSAIEKRIRNAWIDIFPLDGMPNNAVARKIKEGYLLYRRLLLQYSQFNVIVNQDLPNRPKHEQMLINLGRIIKPERFLDTKKCLKKLDKSLRRCDYEKSDYVVNFMGAYKFKEMFPKSFYDSAVLYDFESEKFIAPKDYDFVLRQMYGDYMKPPEGKDRNKHHSRVIEDKKQ